MVNQVETHVFDQQREARKYMDEIGTHIMSWAPLAEGQNNIFSDPVLTKIGEKYGKTAAQVALRSLVQRGIACIPKTTHAERMRENIAIFDFELSPAEMEQIAALDTGAPLICRHDDPAFIRYIADLCE